MKKFAAVLALIFVFFSGCSGTDGGAAETDISSAQGYASYQSDTSVSEGTDSSEEPQSGGGEGVIPSSESTSSGGSAVPSEQAPPVQSFADIPTTSSALSSSGGAAMDKNAQKLVELVNLERAKAGLGSLTVSEKLNEVALIRAREITELYSHTRPNGGDVFGLLKEMGVTYRYAGENLAASQLDAVTAMKDWMNSEGHRNNILNENYTEIGVAALFDPSAPYGMYWVQIFRA